MEKRIQKAMELAKQLEKRVRDVDTFEDVLRIIKEWYSEVEKLGDPILTELAYQQYSMTRHLEKIAQVQDLQKIAQDQVQPAAGYVVVVKAILTKMVVVMGLLSGLSIVGGIIATVWNALSPTEFTIFGVKLTTWSVGVALVALGLITMLFAIRAVLENMRNLAESKKTS